MPKKPNSKGFSRFDFRPGVGEFPRWRGLNLNDDPATIDGNQFWDAINMRLDGGTILNRGGQTKANTVATTGCVYGIYEVEGTGGASGDPVSPGGGFYSLGGVHPGLPIAGVDSDDVQGLTLITGISTSGADINILKAADQNLDQICTLGMRSDLADYGEGGNFGLLYAGGLLPPKESGCKWGSKILSFGGTVLGTNTGNVYDITNNGAAVNGRLLFNCGSMLSDGISRSERIVDTTTGVDDTYDVLYLSTFTAGKLFRYDVIRGLVTLSSALPVNRTAIGIYRENVYVSGSNAANALYRVNADFSVTALGNPAAGYTGPFIPSGIKQYKDNLYISGWDMGVGLGTGILLKWDGTTLTVVAGVPGGGDLCVYNNFLYIGSGNVVVASVAGAPNEGRTTTFAKWDGTTRTVQLDIETFIDNTYIADNPTLDATFFSLREFKMINFADSALVLAVLGEEFYNSQSQGWSTNHLQCTGTDTTATGSWAMLNRVPIDDPIGRLLSVYGTLLVP